jgi:hypothetical protein
MTQRGDYWRTASYFLLGIMALATCYLLLWAIPYLVIELAMFGMVCLAIWSVKRVSGQRRLNRLALHIDQYRLERLREMHRLGDG